MEEKKTMVAFDCGNSSFRTIVGIYENGKIKSNVISQLPNESTRIGDYFYWDMIRIFGEFKKNLKEIVKEYGRIDSIGISTWGVDFGLFDKEGRMLSNPLCYRNTLGEAQVEKLSSEDKKRMFYETGILCDKINSVYMLTGMRERFSTIYNASDKLLMIPDILNYFLTGVMMNEPSEFSTTQFMNVKTGEVSSYVCDFFNIDSKKFCSIGKHGQVIGYVRENILREIGADYQIPVICVPSHDTGAAVAAIPAKEECFGFISCGTWSLIGIELDKPVLTDDVINAGLTNEVGAFGKITLLKNSNGMFIVNQLKKEYDFESGRDVSWDEITKMAQNCKTDAVLNLNDSRFFNPVSMSEEIYNYLLETEQIEGEKQWDILFKAFYESLACCYSITMKDAESVTGTEFKKVYIVGGGAASEVLLKLSAIHIGKPIVVCYGESTSMGNLGVQLSSFYKDMNLKDIRSIIANSYEVKEYVEDKSREDILERYVFLNRGTKSIFNRRKGRNVWQKKYWK